MGKLIDIRQEQGISAVELAQKANVSKQLICAVEKGRCNFSVATAKRIAKVLKVDWWTLLD